MIYGSHSLKLVCPRKNIKQLWRPPTHATGEKFGGGGGGESGGVKYKKRACNEETDRHRDTDTDGDTEITIFELATVFERGMLSMSILNAYGECILTLSQRRYRQKPYAARKKKKKVQDSRTRFNM